MYSNRVYHPLPVDWLLLTFGKRIIYRKTSKFSSLFIISHLIISFVSGVPPWYRPEWRLRSKFYGLERWFMKVHESLLQAS